MEFLKLHNELKDDFEAYLKAVFENSTAPKEILEAMEYSLFSGGKRLRPVLALYMARQFGVKDGVSLPLCTAIEMIHTYSLIHDDLPAMDNDDLRRGKPTNHKKYGEDMAILAGDGLLNSAFELMLKNVPEEDCGRYIKAVSYIGDCAGVQGMIGGQVMDVKKSPDGIDSLKKMHSLKTGRMFSACIVPMAIIAGLPQKSVDIYSEFSEKFGLLFQITDDILDVIGETEKLGKTAGKDEAEKKITYVSEYGLEKAGAMADETVVSCLDLLDKTGQGNEYLVSLVEYVGQRDR